MISLKRFLLAIIAPDAILKDDYIVETTNLNKEISFLKSEFNRVVDKFNNSLDERARLIELIRAYDQKVVLLESEQKRKSASNAQTFTDDQLKKMIMLCHPDRHGGKQIAQDITALLNSIRNKK